MNIETFKIGEGSPLIFLFSPKTRLYSKSILINKFRYMINQFQVWKSGNSHMVQTIYSLKHLQSAREKHKHTKFIFNQEFNINHILSSKKYLVILGKNDVIVDSLYTKSIFKNFKNIKIEVLDGGHDAFATNYKKTLEIIEG